MERFDRASNTAAPAKEINGFPKNEVKTEKAVKQESPNLPTPSSRDDSEPPKKKRKPAPSKELDDEQYAKMLQEQENRSSRATRGAAKGRMVKKTKTPKKKVKKEKSERKVRASDDSELDEVGSDGEVREKEKVKKGGFHKLYHLSAPLADLVGEPTVRFSLFSPYPSAPSLLCLYGRGRVLITRTAFETPSRQEDMGVYQSKRPARPKR